MASDLTFFLAWFENEYYIYQLRNKGFILSRLKNIIFFLFSASGKKNRHSGKAGKKLKNK
jgi:hypothetical protein